MERLLQYLDDIDDLVGLLGLAAERLRAALAFATSAAFVTTIVVGGSLLAQQIM